MPTIDHENTLRAAGFRIVAGIDEAKDELAEEFRPIIGEVLARSGGNKTLAAKQLGVTRWMLDRRRKPRA
mgnify:CR=1 FL=1